jgi:integrase/recombinase XerD
MTKALVPVGVPAIDEVMETVIKRLHSDRSRVEYLQDMKVFAAFLRERGLVQATDISYADMVAYQDSLSVNDQGRPRSPRRVNRMFTVARQVLDVQKRMGALSYNPAAGVDALGIGEDNSPHIALDDTQAEQLLEAIDLSTKYGKQEYAVMSLLLRTGLRRAECASLKIGSMDMDGGHFIIRVTGKGGYRDTVKLPGDVKRYIQEWIDGSGRKNLTLDSPLFVGFNRGDHPSEQQINPKWIERMVLKYAAKIGLRFTPHSLRATFITLALEHKATLTQTQYAARHKDPRQTEHYQRRKLNLDDNAVDKLSFLSRKD